MLSPASGFLVPWHSKQYFWKVDGGVALGRVFGGAEAVRAGAVAERLGANAGD